MVGADVFICYKKSINRPDLLSYKPSLLHRFPLKNNPTYKLENTVALFCLPMGATLECWPAETTRPPALSSTFVLTLASREKVYGSAITFYEEYDEELLTEAQETALNLHKYRRKTDRSVFANRCICLLSRWPFFEAFEEFLFFLHKVFRNVFFCVNPIIKEETINGNFYSSLQWRRYTESWLGKKNSVSRTAIFWF